MKKILILEDNLDLLKNTGDLFEKNGYPTIKCSSIVQAKQEMKTQNNINLICTDLNLATDGLTDEQIECSFGTRIAGWIWLVNYVYNEEKNKKIKCIIHSAYIADLKEYIKDCEDEKELALFNNATCFEKNIENEDLILCIKEVLK